MVSFTISAVAVEAGSQEALPLPPDFAGIEQRIAEVEIDNFCRSRKENRGRDRQKSCLSNHSELFG
jgi:hypothetical protein